ncbi:guanylyl cyclase C [Chanodichthys erythropterus]|uniref:guanylyl cyclase C n=1 Tax=Chanodichthys erythropterus TaxID=933992 RepID=UPI00351F498B
MLGLFWFWFGSVLCVSGFDVLSCRNSSVTLNVVLLEDEDSPWSLKFVKDVVEMAVEVENKKNQDVGLDFQIKVLFSGFNTTHYRRRGCGSSTCEAVEILKSLYNKSELGCVMLGPSCTYATFQLVDQEVGLTLTIPIISAGSFGLSCDYKEKLTRLLPPARKISEFFVHFWHEHFKNVKPQWKTAYIYKKPNNTEECFWYINALEAPSALFSSNISREMLRNQGDLKKALEDKNRHSNIFVLCGTPDDVLSAKNNINIPPNVVFVLIDLYNEGYHTNASSFDHMRNVLVVTMHSNRSYSNHSAWQTNGTALNDYVVGYHDAVVLFGKTMRDNLLAMKNQPFSESSGIIEHHFRNTTFEGVGGHYELDASGDRDLNLSVVYTSSSNKYKTLFVYSTSQNETKVKDTNPDLYWDRSQLPSDRPDHGIEVQHIIMIVLGLSVVMATAVAFILYRQNRRVRFDQKKWSHIAPSLITPLDDKERNHFSLRIDEDKKGDNSVQIHKGRYDKKPVILKELRNTDGNFSEDQRIELNSLLRIDYYNLTKFYGTVKFECGVFGVFEFCERGSLRSVLNDKISYPDESFMDLEFKISVMYDIAKGMSYLHSSNVGVHGRLKSTNCVVDNRMVVKITDFGCNTILMPGKDLWTAPEHMRVQGISQKGDVYSFAIISQEIILRKSTFHTSYCSDTAEKIYCVQYPRGPNVFRPDLSFESVGETEAELFVLIKSCWEEDPEKRPDFKRIEGALGKIFSNFHNQANASYMDNLIRRLQMYSRNLEHLVEERTALYKAERDRADQLNFMLLPGPVVRSLKETGRVEPELYDEVTIYFSDIVCFTTLCHHSTPMEVVDMLNDIYKNFDSILDHHDVYKVETIGDAYMVASGLPKRNGNRHAVDICLMALDILEFMGTFQLRHLPGIPLWIRIGIHSGPCAAGVVGNKMPRYCLFGDTVNTASRMESTGLPLRIHVSESTIQILQRTDCQFECERRGETYLKGKGKEMTYWLTGVTGQKYNLPTPPTAENFQRLQQDLAERIVSTLNKRGNERRKTLSTRQRRTQRHSSDGQLEYLHLTDPATYL